MAYKYVYDDDRKKTSVYHVPTQHNEFTPVRVMRKNKERKQLVRRQPEVVSGAN